MVLRKGGDFHSNWKNKLLTQVEIIPLAPRPLQNVLDLMIILWNLILVMTMAKMIIIFLMVMLIHMMKVIMV